mmetsp:Transcript_36345/g.86021  ORF Transcript_36345/g.86021 Transcript_36345/m.86021 type:complete len:224 (+) Transcript_36345:2752-3423(+)
MRAAVCQRGRGRGGDLLVLLGHLGGPECHEAHVHARPGGGEGVRLDDGVPRQVEALLDPLEARQALHARQVRQVEPDVCRLRIQALVLQKDEGAGQERPSDDRHRFHPGVVPSADPGSEPRGRFLDARHRQDHARQRQDPGDRAQRLDPGPQGEALPAPGGPGGAEGDDPPHWGDPGVDTYYGGALHGGRGTVPYAQDVRVTFRRDDAGACGEASPRVAKPHA